MMNTTNAQPAAYAVEIAPADRWGDRVALISRNGEIVDRRHSADPAFAHRMAVLVARLNREGRTTLPTHGDPVAPAPVAPSRFRRALSQLWFGCDVFTA